MNILKNPIHPTPFKAVHTALALVSVAFAVAIWLIAGKNRRRINQDNGLPPPERAGGAPEGARRAV